MNIVVIAGGISEERDVSLASGAQISNALIKNNHKVLLIDLADNEIKENSFYEAHKKYHQDFYSYEISEEAPNIENFNLNNLETILNICKSSDIVFIALHGGIGENGQLQSLFELYNIKYTGSDFHSSSLAMDKIISKIIFKHYGFKTADWIIVDKTTNEEKYMQFKLPAVVKPNDNGSSIGVEIVNTHTDLLKSISKSLKHSKDSKILIESKIEGREFSVGILDNSPLPVIELMPKGYFYDYKHKYQNNLTVEVTPASISKELTEKLQAIALKIHKVFGLSVYSRTDFIVEEKTKEIYVIEVNSLPGMTPNSLIPQEAAANGINYNELCNKIVTLSLNKYN